MNLFDVYPLYNITPTKGKDVFIYDNTTKYLDLYGGHGVISIGHSHPDYTKKISDQLNHLGFYSNSVQNPLQNQLAEKLGTLSGCNDYQLFLCNSGAEANENALKLASFHTNKHKVIAFKNGFHGRTSAAVAATDNTKITAPINTQHEIIFLELGDYEKLKKILQQNDICAVILEFIQGVGGLDEPATSFAKQIEELCKKHHALLIADEIQCGYGRSGDFFAFQKHGITPDIISIAKGMGNGFPVGGILIHPTIKPQHGILGTTFGGNHLACAASLAVLEVIDEEQLLPHVKNISNYFMRELQKTPLIKSIKGRGLMIGLEFDFPIAELRKTLIRKHHIFTGNSKNPNLLRILPPLTLQKKHIDHFITTLKKEL